PLSLSRVRTNGDCNDSDHRSKWKRRSEVLKQALAVGLKIRATFQSPDKAAKAPAGMEGVIMDYAKPDTIRPALHGVEKIFLVGPPVRDLPAMEANFIKEVRAAGRKHIVKLSALGGHESMFPSGHRHSEENIEASGLPYTFLRPNVANPSAKPDAKSPLTQVQNRGFWGFVLSCPHEVENW